MAGHGAPGTPGAEHRLERHQLLSWQQRVAAFQKPLFAAEPAPASQPSLFGAPALTPAPAEAAISGAEAGATRLQPLSLQPQSLLFWRWPEPPQTGAALYLVVDQEPSLPGPLLLYVGETGEASRRWKGTHDCKSYLEAYGEASATRVCPAASASASGWMCPRRSGPGEPWSRP
ncbi:hypothetical protein [Cyanobium sp. LEGE 06113]|uniref:hypothetical protein n=1 Tax=Cyanobium sp. LEGE 06113 TaxID=1297573 RepID=UPI00351C08F2